MLESRYTSRAPRLVRGAPLLALVWLAPLACGDEGGGLNINPQGGARAGGPDGGNGTDRTPQPLKCVTETRDTVNTRLLALRFDYFDRSTRLVRTERDLDADGTLEEIQTWTYGPSGKIEEESFDDEVNGKHELWQHRYNADGRLVESRGDTDGDGEIDKVHRYVYRSDGTPQHRDEDNNADGINDARTIYRFDNRGNMVAIELDQDIDNVIEARIENRYDDQDRIVEITADWDADGRIEQRELFVYTADRITQQRDLDGDGRFDEIWIRHHQENGRITSVEADLDADGTPDRRMTFDYECFAVDAVAE